MSLNGICSCCFYRLKTAENGLNGDFILNHKALGQIYLDISEYTDKEGQKRTTFRILADTYRLF